jgi:hypothetical protein
VAGGASAGGGVSVAGGASAGGGVSVAGGASAGGGVSVAGGGACAVCSSPAGGASVGQLPLASGVEPSGHDCAYEGCSIDDGDDCTVRIAAVTSSAITIIVIEDILFMVFFTMNIKEIGRFYPLCEQRYRNSEKKREKE